MAIVTNESALFPLDVLHCGALPNEKPVARLWHRMSRRFTARGEDSRNYNIAVHTALVFPLRRELFCVEMIGPDQGLRLSPLNRTWNRLERNIISISRPQGINTEDALDRIVSDLRRGLGYDTVEALRYAFPFLKDDPTIPICSGYAFEVLRDAGQYWPVGMGKTPVALQECATLKDVKGW